MNMWMSRKLSIFLAISLGWSCLVGTLLFAAGIDLSSIWGAVIIALLYMPSPFIAALIAERVLVKSRLKLPSKSPKEAAKFFLPPIIAILTFIILYYFAVYIFGNILQLPEFGKLATTAPELMKGAADLVGQDAVDKAGPPPPPILLLLASIWGAIVAGWTINGLFAMGEEYGWRGLMWEELKRRGVIKANLFIGLAWGLWHAPLILQGYNYPESPIAGIAMMVCFAIGFSFVLTAIREITGSLLPVAAAHGMFNALAAMVMIFSLNSNSLLVGPLGLLGAFIFTIIGGLLWRRTAKTNM